MKHAIPLAEARDDARFGGKAVKLGAALRAGLPVPDGFALDDEAAAALATGDDDALGEVREMLDALGGAVAVRSSAIGEDGDAASFAGQHLTVLNAASPGAVIEAIAAVRASAHGDGASAYRRRQGIGRAPAMGIVVQRLLDPECAGVMFTRHPVDARDEIVIEAAWGLGEVVVAGLVAPDLYRIAKDGRVLEQSAGVKDIALYGAPGGGTREEAVPRTRVRALVLDGERLARLHALALRSEQVFGRDLDIEWLIADGELHMVQCRAITSLAAQAVA